MKSSTINTKKILLTYYNCSNLVLQTVLYEHSLAIISKKDDRGKGLITDYTCLRKVSKFEV